MALGDKAIYRNDLAGKTEAILRAVGRSQVVAIFQGRSGKQ
jgi:hypothetical protein